MDWLADTDTELLNYITFLEDGDMDAAQHSLNQFFLHWEKYEKWICGGPTRGPTP